MSNCGEVYNKLERGFEDGPNAGLNRFREEIRNVNHGAL